MRSPSRLCLKRECMRKKDLAVIACVLAAALLLMAVNHLRPKTRLQDKLQTAPMDAGDVTIVIETLPVDDAVSMP